MLTLVVLEERLQLFKLQANENVGTRHTVQHFERCQSEYKTDTSGNNKHSLYYRPRKSMRSLMKFCQLLLLLIPTSASFSLASIKECKTCNGNAFLTRGGSQLARERTAGTKESTKRYASDTESTVSLYEHASSVSFGKMFTSQSYRIHFFRFN